MWLAGLLYTLVYTYAWTLSPQALLARGQSTGPPGHLAPMSNIPVDVYLTVGGLALLMAAPWLTAGVAALDVRAAQALLGPSRAEELEHRVERLTQTRAGVVDAADAERRRLERNLHDGTQQRLVSLAMNLGMARAQTETVEEAHEAIAEAHEEAKAALAELRNLVRGLHPPVLENRGLDAALSGVAARMPIPVRLTVNVPRRPPPTIEAVAYFVVSEGLTNITKHARATPGGGVRAAGRRPAAHHRHRRRRGRRRPGPRHRPGRPGPARRIGRRNPGDRQPARRADPAHRGPAMRAVAGQGRWSCRWVWGLSGLVTAAVLAVPGARLITSCATVPRTASAQPQARHDQDRDRAAAGHQPGRAELRRPGAGDGRARSAASRSPRRSCTTRGDGRPRSTQSVSGGRLSLSDPACDELGLHRQLQP